MSIGRCAIKIGRIELFVNQPNRNLKKFGRCWDILSGAVFLITGHGVHAQNPWSLVHVVRLRLDFRFMYLV